MDLKAVGLSWWDRGIGHLSDTALNGAVGIAEEDSDTSTVDETEQRALHNQRAADVGGSGSFTAADVVEETMTVCYALANVCAANRTYTARVHKNGLLGIMLPLLEDSDSGYFHVEICRQALRCIGSICEEIGASDASGSSDNMSPDSSSGAQVLAALTSALDSDNYLVQVRLSL